MAEWLRCPLCGKKARPGGIGRAGTHRLGKLRLQSLGGSRGWRHFWTPLTRELLLALRIGLHRALDQVNALLGVRVDRQEAPDPVAVPVLSPILSLAYAVPLAKEVLHARFKATSYVQGVEVTPRIRPGVRARAL